MKYSHLIEARVFCKEDKDSNKIKKKSIFLGLFPFNLDEEKIILKESAAKGFNEKKINILEVELTKDKHMNSFLFFFNKLTGERKEMILRDLDKYIDDNLNLFIRLDKQKLLEDKFRITDSGDRFHIKISIAAFPRKKKEKSCEVVKKIFEISNSQKKNESNLSLLLFFINWLFRNKIDCPE